MDYREGYMKITKDSVELSFWERVKICFFGKKIFGEDICDGRKITVEAYSLDGEIYIRKITEKRNKDENQRRTL